MQETQVRSLGWEEPLEKGTVTHSNLLAWGIPWTEELWGLQSMGSERVRHDGVTTQHQQHARVSRLVYPESESRSVVSDSL